jgi:hypothetical protein
MSTVSNYVDHLFRQLPLGNCLNPITGEGFMNGDDPIKPHKARARRALAAREWAKQNAPSYLPPLPVGREIGDIKHGWGLLHLYGYFARSIAARDYVVTGHPPFDVFAQGVLGSPFCHPLMRENEELNKHFPPQHLAGIGPGLTWQPLPKRPYTRADHRSPQSRKFRQASAAPRRPRSSSISVRKPCLT